MKLDYTAICRVNYPMFLRKNYHMKYCSICGGSLALITPAGDNRQRSCCRNCQNIHYVNPKIVVGTIPTFENKVLLCKRAIEPRYGFWTLPAGFMELQETTHEGAIRETEEEAGAKIKLFPLFTMFDVISAEQVHLFFRAEMENGFFLAGQESLEVRLFEESEIPWDELAFKTVSQTLTLFFADRKAGRYALHTGNISNPVTWVESQFKTM
jgi:ADP-ribose pyrophosphatase YjhB (NUDIX family)